jgi:hypothetical protein
MAADTRTRIVENLKAEALANAAGFAALHPLARAFLLRADEIAAGQKVQGIEIVRLTKDFLQTLRAGSSRDHPRDIQR